MQAYSTLVLIPSKNSQISMREIVRAAKHNMAFPFPANTALALYSPGLRTQLMVTLRNGQNYVPYPVLWVCGSQSGLC